MQDRMLLEVFWKNLYKIFQIFLPGFLESRHKHRCKIFNRNLIIGMIWRKVEEEEVEEASPWHVHIQKEIILFG